MKKIVCVFVLIWFITGCVGESDKSTKSTDSSKNPMEKKANTDEPLAIAEINQLLYVNNKFEGVKIIEPTTTDALNTVGLQEAFRYNYLARNNGNLGANNQFFLAVYQYEKTENAVGAVQNYMEIAETGNGFWRFRDFLIPIGEFVLWLHADCTLSENNWQQSVEAVTQTLSAMPKSISCKCGDSCLYE